MKGKRRRHEPEFKARVALEAHNGFKRLLEEIYLKDPCLGSRRLVTALGVKISMDGKGRWMDNVFIERLWRSVKYERIYITPLFAAFSANFRKMPPSGIEPESKV